MENPKNTGIIGTGQGEENTENSKKKRTHKKYKVSIDLQALEELQGFTTSSFVELATAVIRIDGQNYDKEMLPMSKARKIDFERFISYYAQIEIYGKRKYHIKSVFNRIKMEIPNDAEMPIQKKAPYVKPKTLSEAQKKARKLVYEAKKAKAKREKALKDVATMERAQEKINKLNNDQAEAPTAPPTSG